MAFQYVRQIPIKEILLLLMVWAFFHPQTQHCISPINPNGWILPWSTLPLYQASGSHFSFMVPIPKRWAEQREGFPSLRFCGCFALGELWPFPQGECKWTLPCTPVEMLSGFHPLLFQHPTLWSSQYLSTTDLGMKTLKINSGKQSYLPAPNQAWV